MYAIVKTDISEIDDATKRHGNVITIWRTSGFKVTALLKNPRSEMKGMQEKNSSLVCLVMADSDPRDGYFYLSLTPMIESYFIFISLGSLSPFGYLKKRVQLKPVPALQTTMLSYEPAHDKTNKMACAPSEDSFQPGHPPCLIKVFAVRLIGS